MDIKSVFEITKADRYTQDGRDQIAKIQETEDKTYQIGEISQKTGLQKTANGWVPPKETKYGKVTEKNGQVGVQQKLGKGSKFEAFKNESAAKRALANYTTGYNTTERSKQDPHSDQARLMKHLDKETEQMARENKKSAAGLEQKTNRVENESFTPEDIKNQEKLVEELTKKRDDAVGFKKGEYGDELLRQKSKLERMNKWKNSITPGKQPVGLETPAAGSAWETQNGKARAAGYEMKRNGENGKMGGEYRVFMNGLDEVRYDKNGYNEQAQGKQYSAMESGPGGRRRFFDTFEEADAFNKAATGSATPGQNKLAEIAKISGNYKPENLYAVATPKGNIEIVERQPGKSQHSIMIVDPHAYHIDTASLDEEGIFDRPAPDFSDPQLAKEIANSNHFEEQKKEAAKAKQEAELKQQRAEGEANAEAYRKRYEAEHGPNPANAKKLSWNPGTSTSEKLNDLINLGKEQPQTPGLGMGSKYLDNFLAKEMRDRFGASEEAIDDLLDSMDNEAKRNAFKGISKNFYSHDSAPLTGDTKIKVRK